MTSTVLLKHGGKDGVAVYNLYTPKETVLKEKAAKIE
jgi:hypothetical protein